MKEESKTTCSYSLKGAQIYDVACEKYINGELNFILKIWKRHKIGDSARILDIGCGTGNILLPLLKMGFKVNGIDINESMVSVLYQKGKIEGLKPHVNMMDFKDYKVSDSYHAVLALYFFIYILNAKEIEALFQKIYNSLNSGGVLIMNVFNAHELWKDLYKRKQAQILQSGNLVQKLTYIPEDYLRGIVRVEEFGSLKDGSQALNDFGIRRLRFFTLDEIYLFLRLAGFRNIRVYCGFNLDNKISFDTREGFNLVIEANKPIRNI